MRRSVKDMIGYTILATDGEIGKVDEFYFDDQEWTVRYLVVNTGGWLAGRRVLISPIALGTPDWESRSFPVKLTADQVRNSPDIDTDKPVSRQHETALHQYYAWPEYWMGSPYIGVPCGAPPVPITPPERETGNSDDKRRGDPCLRSTRRVTGYHIQAKDGEIGHVEDFILDDGKWDIRYLVVDTRNWLRGRKVVVAPLWIVRVSWKDAKVLTALTQEAVKKSPEYDPSEPINMDYEGKLYDWCGRPSDRGGA